MGDFGGMIGLGGGGGDSGSSSTSQASNDTTVNVTVDNKDVAAALTTAAKAVTDSNAQTAAVNASAIQAVAASMAATAVKGIQAVQDNTKATMDAYAAHVDGGSKATIIAALIGAAALIYHKGR